MRCRLIAALGLGLMTAACGTTVPLTSQQTSGGEGNQQVVQPGQVPGAVDVPTASAAPGTANAGTTGTAVTGTTGTTSGGPAATTGSTPVVPGDPVVDYTKPATGSPVDVGIMYIKDLGAAAAQFGGSGQDTLDQTGIMKAAVAWMNAHGGLGGHKINLLLYGAEIAGSKSYDQSLAEMCAMMTQDHHAVASVIANITVTNNMAQCMQKAKGLYVTDGGYFKAASDWAGLSYTASPSELSADVLGRTMAEHMIAKGAAKKGDTVGLVVYDAPGFHAAEKQFLAVAKANGIEVVSYAVHYASSTPDLANSIAAVQSAVLAMQSRGAKVVASLSSGGIMGFFLQDADQQKYYPRYLLSSNDNLVGAPTAEKNNQLDGAMGVGTIPSLDTDLFAHPEAYASDPTFNTCRKINTQLEGMNAANYLIAQRVCSALLLVQTAAKGYGGADITGTALRDGLRSLGSRISAGTTYRTQFGPSKLWAPSHYRPMHYDGTKNVFVYDGLPLPF
jgi:ABC-type branched-subunit amino acid transport system substrate-binding protein